MPSAHLLTDLIIITSVSVKISIVVYNTFTFLTPLYVLDSLLTSMGISRFRHGTREPIDVAISLKLALPTIRDDDLLARLAGLRAESLDLGDDLHALHNLAEHHVLPVQPLRLGRAQEELRPVGVRARVGHGQDTWGDKISFHSKHCSR